MAVPCFRKENSKTSKKFAPFQRSSSCILLPKIFFLQCLLILGNGIVVSIGGLRKCLHGQVVRLLSGVVLSSQKVKEQTLFDVTQ